MPISGPRTIDSPYLTGFAFVAAQRGASEYQIADSTGLKARTIFENNKRTSSILAFPLAGPRSGVSIDDVRQLWTRWEQENSNLRSLTAMGLHSFRELVDPWLKHDRGRWEK